MYLIDNNCKQSAARKVSLEMISIFVSAHSTQTRTVVNEQSKWNWTNYLECHCICICHTSMSHLHWRALIGLDMVRSSTWFLFKLITVNGNQNNNRIQSKLSFFIQSNNILMLRDAFDRPNYRFQILFIARDNNATFFFSMRARDTIKSK